MRLSVLFALSLAVSACATSSGRPIAVTTIADADQFAQAETVTVQLSDFAFTPATIRLRGGQPYVLRLVNSGTEGHDFTAPGFFQAARILERDAAKVARGQVDLREDESVVIRLIPTRGTYELTCTHFGHEALGMRGYIQVQ